jgi:Snf7
MNLFGKKKKAAPKVSTSIQQLREAQGLLDKRQSHLEAKSDESLRIAKEKLKAKNKRAAMSYLKRKKNYDNQVDKLFGMRDNIEQQIMALENVAANKEVVHAMRIGRDAMQHNIRDNDIEKVDDMLDEINESMALQEEMNEALSRQIGTAVADDDELMAELEDIESQMIEEHMLDTPQVSGTVRAQPQAQTTAQPASKLMDVYVYLYVYVCVFVCVYVFVYMFSPTSPLPSHLQTNPSVSLSIQTQSICHLSQPLLQLQHNKKKMNSLPWKQPCTNHLFLFCYRAFVFFVFFSLPFFFSFFFLSFSYRYFSFCALFSIVLWLYHVILLHRIYT